MKKTRPPWLNSASPSFLFVNDRLEWVVVFGSAADDKSAPLRKTLVGCVIVKPILQALILADHVYEDKATGKKVIAGTFNQLTFRRAPTTELAGETAEQERKKQLVVPSAGSPSLYISLTEVRGKTPLSIRYVDLSDNIVLFHVDFPVNCTDPLQHVELILRLPKFPVRQSGAHALELLTGNEPLGSLRILVVEDRSEDQTTGDHPEATDND